MILTFITSPILNRIQRAKFAQCLMLSAYVLSLFISPIASARTDLEDKIFKEAMPHINLDFKGSLVKVQRAHLEGYLEGTPDNQVRLKAIRAEVQHCVKALQKVGHATNPPSQWPDFLISQRQDIYLAENRTIRYVTGIAYGVNGQDCSLIESVSRRAELQSSKGICSVDLERKTAKGVCDGNGHADAAIAKESLKPALGFNALPPGIKLDPKMVSMVQSLMAANDTRTGEKKTIAGLDCEVWNLTGGAENGTFCLATGGSFRPSRASGSRAHAGLILQSNSKDGYKTEAVEAKLDDQVNTHIFTPYTEPGFSVKNIGGR